VWAAPCAAEGEPFKLADTADFYPSLEWSADRQTLVLKSTTDGENDDVVVFQVAESFEPIAKFTARELAWAPSGRKAAVTRDQDGATLVYELDFGTTPPTERELFTISGTVWSFDWADEQRLFYTEYDAEGTYRAHLLAAAENGSEPATLEFPPEANVSSIFYDAHSNLLLYVERRDGLEQAYAVPLGEQSADPQPILDAPVEPELYLSNFAPDGTGFLLEYHAEFPLRIGTVWWVPLGPEGVGKPLQVNTGSYASSAELRPGP
jgi:hypothetical protein